MKRSAAIALGLILFSPAVATAWGFHGHEMVSRLGAQSFPGDLPAFVRTPAAVQEIMLLGPEEDRLKGSGPSWDADNDPGHYLNVRDDGTVDGVVALKDLPASMEAYTLALEPEHANAWSVGYLPYSIADGFEQLRTDFALWRVYAYGATHARSAGLRARFAQAEQLRQTLTLRDIGVWSHFIADGSQPLHVTVHFNGWGNYPDPNGYTHAPIHSLFESDFVDRYVSAADVRAVMTAMHVAQPSHLLAQQEIAALVGAYLSATSSQVIPLYRIAGNGGEGFRHDSATARIFTARQLAHGAGELAYLTDLAWKDSRFASIGYPAKPLAEILNGTVPLSASLIDN